MTNLVLDLDTRCFVKNRLAKRIFGAVHQLNSLRYNMPKLNSFCSATALRKVERTGYFKRYKANRLIAQQNDELCVLPLSRAATYHNVSLNRSVSTFKWKGELMCNNEQIGYVYYETPYTESFVLNTLVNFQKCNGNSITHTMYNGTCVCICVYVCMHVCMYVCMYFFLI